MALAISSLPVPVSPVTRTVESVGATFATRDRTTCSAGEEPTISSNIRLTSISSRRARFSLYNWSFKIWISSKAFFRATTFSWRASSARLRSEISWWRSSFAFVNARKGSLGDPRFQPVLSPCRLQHEERKQHEDEVVGNPRNPINLRLEEKRPN